MPRFRAIFWDLGGVLLRTMDRSGRAQWETRLGLEPGALDTLVFRSSASQLAGLGRAREEDIWNEVGGKLGLSPQQTKQLAIDHFAGDRIDPVLMDAISQLRPYYKIGLITNAWPGIRAALETPLEIISAFDSITVSAEVGIAKPEPGIFHIALASLDLRAAQAVFVDDFVENVEGARGLGMAAIHFRDPEQALAELAQLLSDDDTWAAE